LSIGAFAAVLLLLNVVVYKCCNSSFSRWMIAGALLAGIGAPILGFSTFLILSSLGGEMGAAVAGLTFAVITLCNAFVLFALGLIIYFKQTLTPKPGIK
jgi:hypothetical protein